MCVYIYVYISAVLQIETYHIFYYWHWAVKYINLFN